MPLAIHQVMMLKSGAANATFLVHVILGYGCSHCALILDSIELEDNHISQQEAL